MISKIGIKNFKSFKNYEELELKKLTVLSGVNSSGKSSLYQILFILKQSINKHVTHDSSRLLRLRVNGNDIRIGSTEEILSDPKERSLTISISLSNGDKFVFTYRNSQNIASLAEELTLLNYEYYKHDTLRLSAKFCDESQDWEIYGDEILSFYNFDTGRLIDNYLQREIDKNKLSHHQPHDKFNPIVTFSGIKNVKFEGLTLARFQVTPEQLSLCVNKNLRHLYKPETFKKILLSNKANDYKKIELISKFRAGSLIKFLKEDLIEIPAFRGFPQRVYTEGAHSNPLFELITRRDETVSYKFNEDSGEIEKTSLHKALNYWVSEYFNLADEVEVNELLAGHSSEILLRINNKHVSINNMGFGVGQILPIIFKALSTNANAFIMVDEPEIHLHPNLQSKLGHFFIHMALIGKEIILETHSESLLHSLIYAHLANDNLHEKIKMLWVGKEDKEKGSKIKEIRFDELGYLQNPPAGFLDERKKLTEEINKKRKEKLGL